MDRETGLVEDEIVRVQVTGVGKATNAKDVTAQDLVALRSIPGVKSVVLTNMIPFGNSSWNSSASTIADDPHSPINAATYLGTEDFIETFGVQLIAGRDFNPDEYIELEAFSKDQAKMSAIIITKGIADKLYPDGALGKPFYIWGKDPHTIVGIVDHLSRPNEYQGKAGAAYATIMPLKFDYTTSGNYVMRVDPERKAEVLAAVDAALDKVDPNRIILERQTFEEIRKKYFRADRAMAYLLVGVSIALLIITALGIVGLASFWVQQRTRQIGIRRALGATRRDILRYFQLENFILATLGIVLGMGLAYAINMVLMDKYEVARLPGEFLPVGALLLWILGQIAVLGPAVRASLIPPAIATRTV
jgi:putative ABC transport system permease protein